jgi:hypothetical protein
MGNKNKNANQTHDKSGKLLGLLKTTQAYAKTKAMRKSK